MKSMLNILLVITMSLAQLNVDNTRSIYSIAIASCWHQHMGLLGFSEKQPWTNINMQKIDALLFLGDTTYADTEVRMKLLSVYNTPFVWLFPKLHDDCANLPYGLTPVVYDFGTVVHECLDDNNFFEKVSSNMKRNFELLMETDYARIQESSVVMPLYDDHDFGADNWDRMYSHKKQALRTFVSDFPKSTPWNLEGREQGLYQSYLLANETIHVIQLDDTYFMQSDAAHWLKEESDEGYFNKTGTYYGEKQWMWLEEELSRKDITPKIRIICQGSGFVWSDVRVSRQNLFQYPTEVNRFKKLIARTKGNEHLILVNGDWHVGCFKHGELFSGVTGTQIAIGSLNSYKGVYNESTGLYSGCEYFNYEHEYGILQFDNNVNLLKYTTYDSQSINNTVLFSKTINLNGALNIETEFIYILSVLVYILQF